MNKASNPVLETAGVCLSSDSPVRPPDLRLVPGDLAWVDASETTAEDIECWLDVIMGLREPFKGHVAFDGRTWPQRTAREQETARSAIRRVFLEGGWVSNLDIVENITLSERHHTSRPLDEIMNEAHDWACKLGLAGLPPGRTSQASRQVLQTAQWVRALMGRPRLILIAGDGAGDNPAVLPPRSAALAAARSRGAAIVWAAPRSGPPQGLEGAGLSFGTR